MLLFAIIWVVLFLIWTFGGWYSGPGPGWNYGRHGILAILIGMLGWLALHGILSR